MRVRTSSSFADPKPSATLPLFPPFEQGETTARRPGCQRRLRFGSGAGTMPSVRVSVFGGVRVLARQTWGKAVVAAVLVLAAAESRGAGVERKTFGTMATGETVELF